jgi:TonB family protein
MRAAVCAVFLLAVADIAAAATPAPIFPPWRLRPSPNHGELPEHYRWDEPPIWQGPAWPVYPPALLRAGTKGTVDVRFVLDAEGRVQEREVVAADHPDLALAVNALLDSLTFLPARRGGQPCGALVRLSFKFDPQQDLLFPDEQAGYDPKSVNPDDLWSREYADAGLVTYKLEASLQKSIGRGKTRVATMSDLDGPPLRLATCAPVYPRKLLPQKTGGATEVEFIVDREGRVRLPRIVSATAPEFGYAAAQAVAQWRFEPPKSKGKKVHVRVVVPFEFQPPETAK